MSIGVGAEHSDCLLAGTPSEQHSRLPLAVLSSGRQRFGGLDLGRCHRNLFKAVALTLSHVMPGLPARNNDGQPLAVL